VLRGLPGNWSESNYPVKVKNPEMFLSKSNQTRTMKDALEYFSDNLVDMIVKYEGEYVAIIEDKVIAHGKDARKVYLGAKKKFPKQVIFLGQVPRKEAMIL
jgi:hypothetical protein